MIVWLLLFVAGLAYGASIPPQPVIPTSSICLQGCFETGSLVNAAFDLLNFKNIAVDIENFCSLNAGLLKCGRECPAEQIQELEARTEASSFICADKIEEFRLVSGCLEGAEDVMAKCAALSGVPTDVPLRLDSSPAASVNPTVFLDGAASICKKHISMVKCSQEVFNKECAGSGDLFKDIARHQIRSGIEHLAEDSSNDNMTTVKLMAQNYLKNLPAECAFLRDLDEFTKALEANEDDSTNSTISSTVMGAVEVESVDIERIAEANDEKKTTMVAPQTESSDVQETTTSATTVHEEMSDEEHVEGGFIKTTNDEISSEITSSTLKAEQEADMVPLQLGTTIFTPIETTPENKQEGTDLSEEKTEIGMDVNSLDETTIAITEPIIVVDDAAESVGENDIQAGIKEEVKSSSAGMLIFSTLFAIGAMLLVV